MPEEMMLVHGDFGKFFSELRDSWKEFEKLGVVGLNTQVPNLNQETFNDSWAVTVSNVKAVLEFARGN